MRKVAATLRDSCFQLCLDTLAKFKLIQYCVVNLSTLTITLPNGSKLLFRGLDDVEKLKSIAGITDIWFEEATEGTEEDFLQLDLRLRAKVDNLQFYLSFNPVSKANWCYRHWFENGTPDNTFILKTTYKDNAFLPAEYVTRLQQMQKTNPVWFKIYAEGEFSSLDKLVYNNWKEESFDWRQLKGQLCIGLDFGYVQDESALIACIVNQEDKTIHIFDEMYQKGLLNNQIAEIIKYKGYAKEVIIADSAEQKSIEEIKRLGIARIKPAVKGQGSILQGIQLLQQYKIIVHPSCVNVQVELQNYAWTKDRQTGEYINTPIDKYNHALDALRYSMQCLDNNQRLQTMSKLKLGL